MIPFSQYMLLFHAVFPFFNFLLLPLAVNDAPQFLLLSTLLAHAPEYALALIQLPQLLGSPKLGHLPIAQDQNPVEIGNSTQAVSNDYQRRVCKFLANAVLDQAVGVHVDRRRGFIEHHDARSRNYGACKA